MKEIVAILALGVGAQWAAWRLGVPAILLLLLFGLLAGPVFGVIDPEALIGDALFPVISLAVGIILFEGGMSNELAMLLGAVVVGIILLRSTRAGNGIAYEPKKPSACS